MHCFLREQLNHPLVVLVSIPACLWFLSVLLASGPYLTLRGLIFLCIYLILRCLLSDMCGSLFSMVIMFSTLINRMLIYIFLLLSIIIISYYLSDTTHCISGKFYFWAVHSPKVFTALTEPILFLAIAGVSELLSVWMTSWSWFTLSRQVRGLIHFYIPYWFALNFILVIPNLTFASLRPFVSWGYVGILSVHQYLYLLIS